MIGGGCPAEQIRNSSEEAETATQAAVANSSGSKYWKTLSVKSKASSGLAPAKAWTRIVVRSRPITTADRKPWPATSPMLIQTSPDGSSNTSYQSPPTPSVIVPGR